MLRDTSLINAAIEQGVLEAKQVADWQIQARRERRELMRLICFASRTPLMALYQAYAELHDLRFVSGSLSIDIALLRKLPRTLYERRLILPLQKQEAEGPVCIAVANPEDLSAIEQARRLLGSTIKVVLAMPLQLQRALNGVELPGMNEVGQGGTSEIDPVKVLNELFDEAYLLRASDIHFEPLPEAMQIRLRVDGHLQIYYQQFNQADGLSLMSRLKVLAGLDIAEQRMPQDGNLTHYLTEVDNSFDVRVATLPTRFGERATLRLLGSDSSVLRLSQIGFSTANLQRFQETIRRPFGMVLVTGPTGSGKSTTLYAALQEIAKDDVNVMTAEDPVEYVMPGISQVHVSSKVSFSSALRSFLRHDPDVIMVGEIRDGETANIAMKAAMTGHLVFSTVHTNSAISTISRLADMGVERFMIGSTLIAVIAQRLVRRLCPSCKQSYVINDRQQQFLGCASDTLLYRSVGCAHCMGSGYKGRIALFETLWVDADLAELIAQGADEASIRQHASQFASLSQDGQEKLLAGLTSWEELVKLALVPHLANIEVSV